MRLENTVELRCMTCNAWLTSRDVSCGLSQFCENCCPELDRFHSDPPAVPEEEEYAR